MTNYVKDIINKIKDKKCFFDFDGTLCECRFIVKNQEMCSYVNEKFNFLETCIIKNPYKDAKPIKIMQEVINELDKENIFILGRSNGTPENIHKIDFLHTHFPKIKDENIIFVNSSESKCIYLSQIKQINNVDVILIEDDYNTILTAEKTYNINCYHISSFMS